MSLSLAQFYNPDLAPEAGEGDVEFSLENPLVKEMGLDDHSRTLARKNVIEAAAAAARKALDETERSKLAALQKQKSGVYSPNDHRREYMKRQDSSVKAFQPKIVQQLNSGPAISEEADGAAALPPPPPSPRPGTAEKSFPEKHVETPLKHNKKSESGLGKLYKSFLNTFPFLKKKQGLNTTFQEGGEHLTWNLRYKRDD